MLSAKMFGMKVVRYFVGFGPTLYSFRKGETEYGVKAIPAGGFVSIVGMDPTEPDRDASLGDEPHRAFWRFPLWKRTVVLAAGSATHIVLAFLLLFVALAVVGLPQHKPAGQTPAVVGVVSTCVPVAYEVNAQENLRTCRGSDPVSPAKQAGLRAGDQITSINGSQVRSYADVQRLVRAAPVGQRVPMTYLRDGEARSTVVSLIAAQRPALNSTNATRTQPTPTLGISDQPVLETVRAGVIEGIGKSGSLTWQLTTGSFTALGSLPGRIPSLVDSVFGGGQRSISDPISVVGATRIGGEVVQSQGVSGFGTFLGLLASLNIFLGIFNMLPLPPLDGGHIAVAWFEWIRSRLAARAGRPEPGWVDRTKLIPLTLSVIVLFSAFALLTLSADIISPIQLG